MLNLRGCFCSSGANVYARQRPYCAVISGSGTYVPEPILVTLALLTTDVQDSDVGGTKPAQLNRSHSLLALAQKLTKSMNEKYSRKVLTQRTHAKYWPLRRRQKKIAITTITDLQQRGYAHAPEQTSTAAHARG